MKPSLLLTAVAIASLATGAAHAARHATGTLSLGAGYALQESAYADYDDDGQWLPLVRFESEHFFVDRGRAGFKLLDARPHRIGLVVGIGRNAWDPDDTGAFRAFDERHRSVDAGIEYRYRHPDGGQFTAGWMGDLSGKHEGYRLDLGYGHRFQATERFALVPGVTLTYLDSRYADYYYGVSSREAARVAGVPAYSTGAALNYGIGLNATYRLGANWSVSGGASVTWLDGDLEASPLVDDGTEGTLFFGLSYRVY